MTNKNENVVVFSIQNSDGKCKSFIVDLKSGKSPDSILTIYDDQNKINYLSKFNIEVALKPISNWVFSSELVDSIKQSQFEVMRKIRRTGRFGALSVKSLHVWLKKKPYWDSEVKKKKSESKHSSENSQPIEDLVEHQKRMEKMLTNLNIITALTHL